ncbi:hypothetical protein MLD38_001028 [Melastoma candidum]|uniref:Uncharacterized protein n=1 Tax=Melastoma candidum TaxID=119954 RepID=A0ACB9SBX6_9MYRT|nr:hypothetical protein MLD38_001028 [Melastoma candidum]
MCPAPVHAESVDGHIGRRQDHIDGGATAPWAAARLCSEGRHLGALEEFTHRAIRVENLLADGQGGRASLVVLSSPPPGRNGGGRGSGGIEGLEEVEDDGALGRGEAAVPEEMKSETTARWEGEKRPYQRRWMEMGPERRGP